jgi:hypothetical protein
MYHIEQTNSTQSKAGPLSIEQLPQDIADELRTLRSEFQEDHSTLTKLLLAEGRIITLLHLKPKSLERILQHWPTPVATELGVIPTCTRRRTCWD